MRWLVGLCLLIGGCALNAEIATDTSSAQASPGYSSHCASAPQTERGRFRRFHNRVTAKLGTPRHRGIDLIAVESDENQTVGGKLAYSSTDNDLEGEDVVLFACVDDAWQPLGTARTDDRGRFELSLAGPRRLPAGMRDLFAHVIGDGSGVRFLSYVAKVGDSVIVTDVDGTITASENAVFNTVLFGDDIGHRLGAPQALERSGRTVVYLSSRGDQLTDVTRRWLRAHGFPPGPLRLARTSITKPGARTIDFKTQALRSLGVPIHAGIGNRQTDIASYTRAGVPAERIFVKLPEFEADVQADLIARRAIGFREYQQLPSLLQ